MKRLFPILIILFSFVVANAQDKIKAYGWAQRGGKNVQASSVNYKLMETFPNAVVTVYVAGTTTLATIFSDKTGTPKSNPFSSDSSAFYFFYADAAQYDIRFSGVGITVPFTISDVNVGGDGGGGSGVLITFTGDVIGSGTDIIATTISTGAVTNSKIADATIDLTTKVNNVLPQPNGGTGTTTGTGTGSVVLNTNPVISGATINSATLNNPNFSGTIVFAGLANGLVRANNGSLSGGALVSLTSEITNILQMPNGGTGNSNFATGSIPFSNGTILTQDNSNFFWDNTTKRLGILTTVPRRSLDIANISNPQLRLTNVDNVSFSDFQVGFDGTLTVSPTGSFIFNTTGKNIDPFNNFDLSLGRINKKYLSLHVGELVAETLVAQNTIATIGGRILVGPTTQLIADLSAGATTIDVKHNQMSIGDRVYLEANNNVEFIAITSTPTIIPNGFRYTVVRNLDGTGANAWFAGDAVFNTGQTGKGFIDIYSFSSIKGQAGPTIVGNVRNSSTYNDWTENWAIGNLNGICGYGLDTYGICLGKYAAGVTHLTVDSTNGYRIFSGLSTVIGQWNNNGDITVGQVASGQSNTFISGGNFSIRNNTTERIGLSSAGVLTIKDSAGNAVITLDASIGAELTKKLTLSGTNSALAIGTTPPTSCSSGTGIWLDRTGLCGLNSNVLQIKIDATTGTLIAGNGNSFIDASGFAIKASSAFANDRSYKILTNSGTLAAAFWMSDNTPTNSIAKIESYSISSLPSQIELNADGPNGGLQAVFLQTKQVGSLAQQVKLQNTQGFSVNFGSDVFRIDPQGNIIVGAGTISGAATDGFLYIPIISSGAPTTTPTSKSGHVPMVYDTTNNKLCVYNSAWKCVTMP